MNARTAEFKVYRCCEQKGMEMIGKVKQIPSKRHWHKNQADSKASKGATRRAKSCEGNGKRTVSLSGLQGALRKKKRRFARKRDAPQEKRDASQEKETLRTKKKRFARKRDASQEKETLRKKKKRFA
eukprot:6201334-Pleurochrysis_carterae.AAC.3